MSAFLAVEIMTNAHHRREGDEATHGFWQKAPSVVLFFARVHSIRAVCTPSEGLAALLNVSTFAVVFDVTMYELVLGTELAPGSDGS